MSTRLKLVFCPQCQHHVRTTAKLQCLKTQGKYTIKGPCGHTIQFYYPTLEERARQAAQPQFIDAKGRPIRNAAIRARLR